jgi:hypothetical protein
VTVATLEAVETSAFWWWYRQVTPARIFRFIAAGVLGPKAFETGAWAVWLGVALHLFNAFVIVAVYVFASRSLPALTRHPVPWGLAYGAGVHLVMHFLVIPLSLCPQSKGVNAIQLLHSLVSQAVTVGLPSAFFARAARRDPAAPAAASAARLA